MPGHRSAFSRKTFRFDESGRDQPKGAFWLVAGSPVEQWFKSISRYLMLNAEDGKKFIELIRGKDKPLEEIFPQLKEGKKLHFSLIDTDKYPVNMDGFCQVQTIARTVCEYGTNAILIGGTKGTIEQVAMCKLAVIPIAVEFQRPVILFPHNADDVIGFGDKDVLNRVLEQLRVEIKENGIKVELWDGPKADKQ